LRRGVVGSAGYGVVPLIMSVQRRAQ
jgi:hypothetical protein